MNNVLHIKRRATFAETLCIIAVVLSDMLSRYFTVSLFSAVTLISVVAYFVTTGMTMEDNENFSDFIKNKFKRFCVPYFILATFITVFNLVTCVVINRDYTVLSFTRNIAVDVVKYFFGYSYSNDLTNLQFFGEANILYLFPSIFLGLIIAKLIFDKTKNPAIQCFAGLCFGFIPAMFDTISLLPYGVSIGLFAVPFLLIGKMITDDIFEKYISIKYLPLFILLFAIGCITNVKNEFWSLSCNTEDVVITSIYGITLAIIITIIADKLTKISLIDYLNDFPVLIFPIYLFNKVIICPYSYLLTKIFNLPESNIIKLIYDIAFVSLTFVAFKLISKLSKFKAPKVNTDEGKRNPTIDVLRAILIILMIVGHCWCKDGLFSNIVYSFHMLAFIMVSGYFYKHNDNLKAAIFKHVKSLLPYCSFGLLYVFVNDYSLIDELKTVVTSVSFTKNILETIPTVGPVYFISLLFCTKALYILIDRAKSELTKHIIVFTLTVVGIFLGASGYWLPWSLDCSMFCLLFYHIAYNLRKYDVLNKLNEFKAVVFILCSMWYHLIVNGSMELATRNYGSFAYTIIGAVAAFIVTYILSDSISRLLPKILVGFLKLTGQSTLYILIIHTLFLGTINEFIETRLYLDSANIFLLILSMLFQIICGIIVYFIVEKIKSLIKNQIKAKKF